jgi:hypothetical protein
VRRKKFPIRRPESRRFIERPNSFASNCRSSFHDNDSKKSPIKSNNYGRFDKNLMRDARQQTQIVSLFAELGNSILRNQPNPQRFSSCLVGAPQIFVPYTFADLISGVY